MSNFFDIRRRAWAVVYGRGLRAVADQAILDCRDLIVMLEDIQDIHREHKCTDGSNCVPEVFDPCLRAGLCDECNLYFPCSTRKIIEGEAFWDAIKQVNDEP